MISLRDYEHNKLPESLLWGHESIQGAQKLSEENQKVVWAEFLTLS
jgi:hypothetical protein